MSGYALFEGDLKTIRRWMYSHIKSNITIDWALWRVVWDPHMHVWCHQGHKTIIRVLGCIGFCQVHGSWFLLVFYDDVALFEIFPDRQAIQTSLDTYTLMSFC